MSETPAAPESTRDAKARAKADKAYRKAQRPWYKKKRFLLPLVFIIIIILAIALTGGDEGDNGEAGGGTQGAENQGGAQEQENVEDQGEAQEQENAESAFPGAQEDDVVGEAGEELTLGDVSVTAEPLAEGDDTLGATLCTTVSMTNNSDEAVDFNALDWSLQQPSGTISNTGLTGSDRQLTGGQIAPGGNTSGDVCFDVEDPSTSGQYVILYEPVFSFSGDRAAWVEER